MIKKINGYVIISVTGAVSDRNERDIDMLADVLQRQVNAFIDDPRNNTYKWDVTGGANAFSLPKDSGKSSVTIMQTLKAKKSLVYWTNWAFRNLAQVASGSSRRFRSR